MKIKNIRSYYMGWLFELITSTDDLFYPFLNRRKINIDLKYELISKWSIPPNIDSRPIFKKEEYMKCNKETES
jgi:hypothetical protein